MEIDYETSKGYSDDWDIVLFLLLLLSLFSPYVFELEYFWCIFQPLWPVANQSFWLESIMASQPILPPPDVAGLILSRSLAIGFGQKSRSLMSSDLGPGLMRCHWTSCKRFLLQRALDLPS